MFTSKDLEDGKYFLFESEKSEEKNSNFIFIKQMFSQELLSDNELYIFAIDMDYNLNVLILRFNFQTKASFIKIIWNSSNSKIYREKKDKIPKSKKNLQVSISPEKNGRIFKIWLSFKENEFFLIKLDVHNDQVF